MLSLISSSLTHSSGAVKFIAAACFMVAPASWALTADAPQLASRSYLGLPAEGPCQLPRLSANGRFVTFVCLSADIVSGDDNERSDTFMLDRTTQQIRRASLNAANVEQLNHSGVGIPAEDGSFVVFRGEGYFHPDVTWIPPPFSDSAQANIFLRSFTPPRTDLIGRSSTGEGNPGRRGAGLRDALTDRHEVLFTSFGDFRGDEISGVSTRQQMYARNWLTGHVERISARPDGSSSLRDAGSGRLSADGRFVVFTSSADDLTPDNPLSHHQLFLRDRHFATTRRLTFPWRGGEFETGVGNGPNFMGPPTVTRDGQKVLFAAGLNDEFTPDDNPGFSDVYLLDTQSGVTELVSRGQGGASTDGNATIATMNADGRIIAYYTNATNTLPVANSNPAIYVKDMLTGEVVNVTSALGGAPHQSTTMDMSADGRVLVFDWLVDNPSLPDLHGRNLVFTVELRGIQPPRTTVPVPSISRWALLLLAIMLASPAAWSLRLPSLRIN